MMEKLSVDPQYDYIAENIRQIRHQIGEAAVKCGRDPGEIRLMAVTKTVPATKVNAALASGINLLGENKAQELCAKYADYRLEAADVHFIGHLQGNKVRQIVDKVSMIHSVDSLKLAAEIDKQAAKAKKIMDVLIEINIGMEESKSGIRPEAAEEFSCQLAEFSNIRLRGFMAIPPICDNITQIEQYFSDMRQLSVDIQAKKIDNGTIDTLSMGMSGDFEQAIAYGSNIVRLGTAIFGQRDYNR